MPINELYKNKSTLIAKAKQHRADAWHHETKGDWFKPGDPERKKAAHKANRHLKASNIASKMAGHKFSPEEETSYNQQVALQELSKKLLSRYVRKSSNRMAGQGYHIGKEMAKPPGEFNQDQYNKLNKGVEKRRIGIVKATKRLEKD